MVVSDILLHLVEPRIVAVHPHIPRGVSMHATIGALGTNQRNLVALGLVQPGYIKYMAEFT